MTDPVTSKHDPKSEPEVAKPSGPPGITKLEVGSAATAKVSFKDNSGAEAKVTRVEWASDNAQFSVVPDEKDPTSAKVTVAGAGRAYITATGVGENGGTAVASTSIVAFDKGALAKGEITVTPGAPAAKPEEQPKASEPAPVGAEATHSTSPAQPAAPPSSPQPTSAKPKS